MSDKPETFDLDAIKARHRENADFVRVASPRGKGRIAECHADRASLIVRVEELESLLSGRTMSCALCNENARKVEDLEERESKFNPTLAAMEVRAREAETDLKR